MYYLINNIYHHDIRHIALNDDDIFYNGDIGNFSENLVDNFQPIMSYRESGEQLRIIWC